jgi:hypothetical protein
LNKGLEVSQSDSSKTQDWRPLKVVALVTVLLGVAPILPYISFGIQGLHDRYPLLLGSLRGALSADLLCGGEFLLLLPLPATTFLLGAKNNVRAGETSYFLASIALACVQVVWGLLNLLLVVALVD